MLGVNPIAGRGFTAQETTQGGPAVVVISDGFWTRAFGRDPSAVGQSIRIDDRSFTVIGIMQTSASSRFSPLPTIRGHSPIAAHGQRSTSGCRFSTRRSRCRDRRIRFS
jgi:hypothetical protein